MLIGAVVLQLFSKYSKIKLTALKWKASVIILQVFVFDKTYHFFLSKTAWAHSESSPSVRPWMNVFKVNFSVSCFQAMPLNRTKLRYGSMKVKAYEKSIWMIELSAIYILKIKGSFLVHPESALWVYLSLHFLWWDHGCD